MAEAKVAVCTGSGRPGGLGEAILRRFGEEGYRLVVTDVDGSGTNHLAKPDEMEAVTERLRSAGVAERLGASGTKPIDELRQRLRPRA